MSTYADLAQRIDFYGAVCADLETELDTAHPMQSEIRKLDEQRADLAIGLLNDLLAAFVSHVYVVVTDDSYDNVYAFKDQADAEEFTDTFDDGTYMIEVPVIDAEVAKTMLAERKEVEA